MTKNEDGIPVAKISKQADFSGPLPTDMFITTAQLCWRACKTSVRIRLALDAEWNDTHPHVLTVADADRVVGVMQFEDAIFAKQAYDTMDNTLRQLERWAYLTNRVRFWGRQVLSFAAVAAFVWLVLLWIG